MEICLTKSHPHVHLIDALFIHKKKVMRIFQDVLGIHSVDHISVTRIDSQNNILVFSSAPAMEYNLFNSNLWQFDNTYNPDWFKRCSHASWQALYSADRYDELYYLRQVKHRLPLGVSLATKTAAEHLVYSLASKTDHSIAQDIFANEIDVLYRIGQYCSNELLPLFRLVEQQSFSNLHKGDQ